MVCVPAKASRRLQWGALCLVAVMATMAVMTDPADARQRRKRAVKKPPVQTQAIQASPRYAAIVVDAKSGKTLHDANADGIRHPASLTKIMTLYMLFEQLEAGKLKLHSPLEVSAHAAAQAPTKIGVKPSQTLLVEDAIKALVTKSANDAAVVVAEALAGTEDEFARQMTRKARALGMNRTVYRNASGLPDPAQVTTAREQAVLGMAIQERFPRYYRYFSLTSFSYRGHAMRNHNKLLGRVHGVDGIKTGYIRASGFNLVSSVRRGDRHIVAVVLGGASGAQRDARMRTLIEGHVMLASTTASPNRAVAAAPVAAPAPAPAPAPEAPRAAPQLASAVSVPILPPSAAPAPRAPAAKASGHTLSIGSTDPIQPVPVKTLVVKLAPAKAAPAPKPVVAKPAPTPVAAVAAPVQPPAPVQTVKPSPAAVQTASLAPVSLPEPAPAKVQTAAVSTAKAIVPVAPAAETKPAAQRSGWIIQIGAFEAEAEAKQRLNAAQTKAAILKKADPYTERTTRGEKTYFRARFAGFDRDQAEAACKQLKRSDIICISMKI
jgi:D-alanyl-D-alanine carboxypeptidase